MISRHQAMSNVSTHSRPKAAGSETLDFNPPEEVSTHSRPKAAGRRKSLRHISKRCFNTQPPEGGWSCFTPFSVMTGVSTHSRPKAAGFGGGGNDAGGVVSTHSRPKAAGAELVLMLLGMLFQHTAARRRLDISQNAGTSSV